jgi:hypothetical protein
MGSAPGPIAAQLLALLGGAIATSTAAAWLLARRPRGNPRLMIASGVGIATVTALVGMRLDVGPLFVSLLTYEPPSLLLRLVLTITGTVGLFLLVAGIALRKRSREQHELGD